ncbi:hypothetical protein RRG08_038833 [Elysia crispata]|uniref:Uncharacterized protein n=1 Tax=Elysia crispata TaxID=231223 RepID=A0AAE0YTQ5_9GAST|nr:hypothetical protein RRG08_038833 [Elysia crispata]
MSLLYDRNFPQALPLFTKLRARSHEEQNEKGGKTRKTHHVFSTDFITSTPPALRILWPPGRANQHKFDITRPRCGRS